jgi:hypothetical protein
MKRWLVHKLNDYSKYKIYYSENCPYLNKDELVVELSNEIEINTNSTLIELLKFAKNVQKISDDEIVWNRI